MELNMKSKLHRSEEDSTIAAFFLLVFLFFIITIVGCSESGHGNGIPWTKDGYRVKYNENGKEIITNEKMWD